MESGIISNLIDYYRDHPRYSKENLWAWREFFGGGYRPTDLEMGWFVEWYLFEFRLKNGNSVLEEHVQNNPWRESEQMLNLYRNLADAKFGLYEVLRVDLGEGLRLRNVQNAEEVEVKECSATYQTKDGMLVLARIAQVGDHNEIVGSDTPMLDTRIGSGLRDYLRQTTDTLTMRNILQMSQDAASSSELGESALNETLYNEMSRAIDPAKTKNNFTVALRDLELERLVDVGKVQEWIERSTFEDSFTPLAMLLGLVSSDIELKKLNRLIEVMNDFMNVTPRESLGGKSPQEMVQSNPDHQSDIMTDQMLFGINCCGDEMDEAFGYMQNRQFRKSARVYCKVFEQLLKHRTTLYEIYRLYANKATAHYYCGEHTLGDAMLGIALQLNPKYDFALDLAVKVNISPDELQANIVRYSSRKPPKSIERDAGYRYYKYLRKFGINFSTTKLTKTPRTNIVL